MTIAAIFDAKNRFNTMSNISNSLCSSSLAHDAQLRTQTSQITLLVSDINLLKAQVVVLSTNQQSLATTITDLTQAVKAMQADLIAQRQIYQTIIPAQKLVTDIEARLRAEMNAKEEAINKRIESVEKAHIDVLEQMKKIQSDSLTITSIVRNFNARQQAISEIAHSVKIMVVEHTHTSNKLDAVLKHLKVDAPPTASVLIDNHRATDYTSMVTHAQIATESS